MNDKKIYDFIEKKIDKNTLKVRRHYRGHIKQALIKIGFPVEDIAGYEEGTYCSINTEETLPSGENLK